MVAVEIESIVTIPREVRAILLNLASNWSDVADYKALEVEPLKGAMTNQVYQVKWPVLEEEGKSPRKVLVRVYGDSVDTFFNREDEIQTFECMSRHGQGPKLLHRFANGRVEEFIHAKTLCASDLQDSSTSALIAAKLKEFHGLDIPGWKKAALWDRLRAWLKQANNLASTKEAEEFQLHSLKEEITTLQNRLQVQNESIGFCHNDLQCGNIMMDVDTKSVTIIDYEYASYNPIAYDIANHFCEMAADYSTNTPHILNYDMYPELDERKQFVHAYLASSGKEPFDDEVEDLILQSEKYTLASHLLWGLWAIVSAHVNHIDFNYVEYARQRFAQYWQSKPKLLGI